MEREVICFYGKDDPFSNFYPCNFEVDGNRFNCVEQYFHFIKAVTFGDLNTASRIMSASDPKEMKKLGRQVTPFSEKIWGGICQIVVYKALLAKFSQNKELKEQLLQTEGALLVEASPRDTLWGVGYGKSNPAINDPEQWRGRNLLGLTLMEVRKTLSDGVNLFGYGYVDLDDFLNEPITPVYDEESGYEISLAEEECIDVDDLD